MREFLSFLLWVFVVPGAALLAFALVVAFLFDPSMRGGQP